MTPEKDRLIVVLDDDPTGVQTVHDVYVYTRWDRETVLEAFRREKRMFFILTNSRGLTKEESRAQHREIAENIAAAAKETGRDFILLSRGNNLRARAEEMFRQADFTPRVRMELAQLVTAYRFADNGIGCTFISDLLVRRPPRGLRLFKLDLPQTRRQFYVLFPKRDYAPFALRAFLKFADNQVWGLRPDQINLPHTSK